MTVNVRTLADFKRFLAQPGATTQVTRNDWTDPAKTLHPLQPKPGYWEPKQVQRLQSGTVQFTSGSWLAFPKAKHARFEGDTVTFCMNQDATFKDQMVYRLSFVLPTLTVSPEAQREIDAIAAQLGAGGSGE